jgi:hypothetical protein
MSQSFVSHVQAYGQIWYISRLPQSIHAQRTKPATTGVFKGHIPPPLLGMPRL